MKKSLLLIGGLSLLLTGCVINKVDETKVVGEPELTEQKQKIEDNSLDSIEEELNNTKIDDSEPDFNALDQDIKQL